MDLSDPDFHRLMLIDSAKMLDGYARLLREAVEAGELVECDTRRLARAITAVCGGSLISWAAFRQGTGGLGPHRRGHGSRTLSNPAAARATLRSTHDGEANEAG
jgi:hypothetical protein